MHPLLRRPPVPPPRPKRRVVIVDDHDFFAACLRMLLDNESDLAVCDVATTGTEVEDRIRSLDPDLLIIDLSVDHEGGLEVGRRLRERHGVQTPILFISMLGRPTRGQLSSISRCAFVQKSRKPAKFLAVLRQVLDCPGGVTKSEPVAFTLTEARGRA